MAALFNVDGRRQVRDWTLELVNTGTRRDNVMNEESTGEEHGEHGPPRITVNAKVF